MTEKIIEIDNYFYFMKYFTINELTKSATASRLKIDNTPDSTIIKNLKYLTDSVLDPIREKWNNPIIVTSGYRSVKLNKAIGGAPLSQHIYGQAADIHTVSDRQKENKELFDLIVKMMESGEIKVGQLIDEKNYNWIHISTPTNRHLNQILHL